MLGKGRESKRDRETFRFIVESMMQRDHRLRRATLYQTDLIDLLESDGEADQALLAIHALDVLPFPCDLSICVSKVMRQPEKWVAVANPDRPAIADGTTYHVVLVAQMFEGRISIREIALARIPLADVDVKSKAALSAYTDKVWCARPNEVSDELWGYFNMHLAVGPLAPIVTPFGYKVVWSCGRGFGDTGKARIQHDGKVYCHSVSHDRLYLEREAVTVGGIPPAPHNRRGHVRYHWMRDAGISHSAIPGDIVGRCLMVAKYKMKPTWIPPCRVGVKRWGDDNDSFEIQED